MQVHCGFLQGRLLEFNFSLTWAPRGGSESAALINANFIQRGELISVISYPPCQRGSRMWESRRILGEQSSADGFAALTELISFFFFFFFLLHFLKMSIRITMRRTPTLKCEKMNCGCRMQMPSSCCPNAVKSTRTKSYFYYQKMQCVFMSNPHLQTADYSVLKHVIDIPKTTRVQVHPCELSIQGGKTDRNSY